MYIPRLDSSCKYYFIGEMIYRWTAPKDLEDEDEDAVFRLKLTTDVPPTTHLSGKLQLSHADAAFSSAMRVEAPKVDGLLTVNIVGVALIATLSLLMAWVIVRLRRRSQRIVLD